VLTSKMERTLYSYDAYLVPSLPDVVVLPACTKEVSQVVKVANEHDLAITSPWGRHQPDRRASAPKGRGGDPLFAHEQNPGYRCGEPHRHGTARGNHPGSAERGCGQGFAVRPDPASQKTSTLGGNAGENAGGPHCLKYGVTTNHILGMEVVLHDGSIMNVGGPAAMEMPGLDLTGVLVGSEGTLAVTTKLTLKLIPQPEAIKTMLAIFSTIGDASNTVSAIIADGIVPATLEMMDNTVIQAVEGSMKAGFPLDAAAVLIIELDGLKDGFERLSKRIQDICDENNVTEVKVAQSNEERMALWAGRKGAFGAISRLRPSYLVADGTVPRTKLPEVLGKVMELGEKYNLRIGNVFHAGDGNLHPLILFDSRDPEETERVNKVGSEILKICAEAGGTISGEHGIGFEKLHEMSFIFSGDDIEYMRRIKHAWDPENRLNPGKILPEAVQ
jgi:glycolate oxidase